MTEQAKYHGLPSNEEVDSMVELFKAFGDKTRYRIISMLAAHKMTVNWMSPSLPSPISLPFYAMLDWLLASVKANSSYTSWLINTSLRFCSRPESIALADSNDSFIF